MENFVNAVILGSGPSGLSMGHQLQKRGISFLILEKEKRPFGAIQKLDGAMRMVSPKSFSLFPGMGAGEDNRKYLFMKEYRKLLENYKNKFNINVLCAVDDLNVKHTPSEKYEFTISYVDNGIVKKIRTQFIINATGIISFMKFPKCYTKMEHTYQALHSRDTRLKHIKRAKKILVVGGGVSAGEILEDCLQESSSESEIVLSINKKLKTMRQKYFGIDFHYFIRPLEKISPALLLTTNWMKNFHVPMISAIVSGAVKKGIISLKQETKEYAKNYVVFKNGEKYEPDLVIFATGYRYETKHLDGVFMGKDRNEDTVIKCESSSVPGLFFLGYKYGRTLASPFLRGICEDSGYVATEIAARIFRFGK